ncbi:Adenylate cyclase (Uncharacterized p rotein) [Umezakia ovalisporum]|nr:Adenylate cyclase (Uncharacterized p rotein) [Umezakia ovalisporum]
MNSHIKSIFVSTLSIITTMTISPSVLGHSEKVALNSPAPVNGGIQKLAQLDDQPEQERWQLMQQAKNLLNQGDLTGAEENLRKLIKKFPRYAFGHFELGNVLFQQDKLEDAINAYGEAIRLNANHALAYNGIGLVYASQGRWTEAITAYQKALDINPNYGDALANSALAFLQNNQQSEGIASLRKALNVFRAQGKNERVFEIEKILQQIKNADDPGIS